MRSPLEATKTPWSQKQINIFKKKSRAGEWLKALKTPHPRSILMNKEGAVL